MKYISVKDLEECIGDHASGLVGSTIMPAEPLYEIIKKAKPLTSVNPMITNQMKANCMGEFSWVEDDPYYNEAGEVIEYEATRVVPWDLCKEIYKEMARISIIGESDE